MNLYKCLLTDNRCYKTNATIKPKGIMVHSTGAPNPLLRRYVQPLDHDVPKAYDPDRETLLDLLGVNKNSNDWNRPDINVCVHAFIGKLHDGSVAVVQTLPWNHRGWHAGRGTSGKSANDTHISFEICEDRLVDQDYFITTRDAATELTAMLCRLYSLDPMEDGVIICHQDGYRRGVASNHGDIYNWWPKFGYTMNKFRQDVLRKTEREDDRVVYHKDMVYYKYFDDVPEYYKPAVKKCLDDGSLKGTGDGEINLSDDSCRILTILDRKGRL